MSYRFGYRLIFDIALSSKRSHRVVLPVVSPTVIRPRLRPAYGYPDYGGSRPETGGRDRIILRLGPADY
jgi:hypothetical protein